MWIIKFKLKHDCVIGNRCQKFKVTTVGTPFNTYQEKGATHAPQIQTLHGDERSINEFIRDLKKDDRVRKLQREGDTLFFIEVRKEKIPSSFYNARLIHVKPVSVDSDGWEHWEVASWDKGILTQFVNDIETHVGQVEVSKIEKTKFIDIHYSKLMPRLTANQKNAIELALKEGFYEWPKRTNLIKLAKRTGISVATLREHLKRAEEKILPYLMKEI